MAGQRWKMVAFLSLAFFLTHAVISQAAERPLRVAYTAIDTVFLPIWVTKGAGFFEKYNLPVEVISLRSSPLCLSAHLAGEIDICIGTTAPVISAYLQGNRDQILFGTLNKKAGFWAYSKPAITSVSGLRGKRFGVTRFGGALDFVSRYFLRQSGLDPNRDVTMIQIGSTPDIVMALAADSIDAGTLSLPSNLKAKELGFRELADFTDVKDNYPSAGISANRQFLIENRVRMEGFVKALIEGIHYTHTNRQEALKILSRNTRVTDMKMLAAAYDLHTQKIWPRVPEITPEDLKLFLEHTAQTSPKALTIDPSDLIYSPLIKEVLKTGLVERLYK